jgi:putative membrane protein
MMWNDGMGWGGWTAMILVMLAFWALVIFGLIAAFGKPGDRKQDARASDQDPQAILRARYARGEIDDDKFRVRQETLRANE